MKLLVCVIILVIVLESCEARGPSRSGGSRSSRRSSRSRSYHRTYDSYTPVIHRTHDSYSPVIHRTRDSYSPVIHRAYDSYTPGIHRTYDDFGFIMENIRIMRDKIASIRAHSVTGRPRVTLRTAGPDVTFSKVNNGRNVYQVPPTLKPLYPKQSYSSDVYRPYQPSPVIVNQPVYVNPSTYYNNHDNSLLGTYLGYKMGSQVHGSHHHYSYDNASRPTYAVVHHYHHYDRPIPKKIDVEERTLGQCGNLTAFCTSNTTALCLTNGTVYCLASQKTTAPCTINSTETFCVNALVTMPCINNTNCDSAKPNVTNILMPCISHINISTDVFEAMNRTVITKDYDDRSKNKTKTFCVTLIAEPLLISKNMTNEQFLADEKNRRINYLLFQINQFSRHLGINNNPF